VDESQCPDYLRAKFDEFRRLRRRIQREEGENFWVAVPRPDEIRRACAALREERARNPIKYEAMIRRQLIINVPGRRRAFG